MQSRWDYIGLYYIYGGLSEISIYHHRTGLKPQSKYRRKEAEGALKVSVLSAVCMCVYMCGKMLTTLSSR